MRNLNGMNDLYNAQDAILLFEILENRVRCLVLSNSRRGNSASSTNGKII